MRCAYKRWHSKMSNYISIAKWEIDNSASLRQFYGKK